MYLCIISTDSMLSMLRLKEVSGMEYDKFNSAWFSLSSLRLVLTGSSSGNRDGTFFYVPAVVWQELHRFVTGRPGPAASHARPGVEWILEKYHSNPSFLFGQAESDRQPFIIKIIDNDDEIINACLRIKQMTNDIILLTEDRILMNRAFVNSIDCFGLQEVMDAACDEEKLKRRFRWNVDDEAMIS